jgi:hypothetical protein
MRKALNENPTVQLAVLGVAAVAFAIILFMTVFKGDPAVTTTDTTATTGTPVTGASTGAPTTPDASGTTAATGTATAPSATDPSATGTVTPPATSTPTAPVTGGAAGTSDGLLASKGLPQDVLVAYAKNQAIALLVIDPKSHGAGALRKAAESQSNKDVAVFVVDVKDIAKYSRITSGVDVSQAPAMVAVRPRKLTESVPTATVTYGIRGAASVKQAIQDALYKGGSVPAYP